MTFYHVMMLLAVSGPFLEKSVKLFSYCCEKIFHSLAMNASAPLPSSLINHRKKNVAAASCVVCTGAEHAWCLWYAALSISARSMIERYRDDFMSDGRRNIRSLSLRCSIVDAYSACQRTAETNAKAEHTSFKKKRYRNIIDVGSTLLS